MRFWRTRPAIKVEPPYIELPATLWPDPLGVRLSRSIGWLALLLTLFPTMVLAAELLRTPVTTVSTQILLAMATLAGWVLAFMLLKKKPAITLSEDSLSVGSESMMLDSQTACAFMGSMVSIGGPKIKVTSSHGSVIFRPATYYRGHSRYEAVNGSHVLHALAAKCSGGDAQAWLAENFPIVASTDRASDRRSSSAKLHPIVKAAFAALVLLLVVLTLAVLFPHSA